MFGKNKNNDVADNMKKLADKAREEVRDKWIDHNDTLSLKKEVPLSKRIDTFVLPVSEYFNDKYPILVSDGGEIFWHTVAAGIVESGTHPKNEINAAFEELRGKYAI
ncbi:MAG: hypothetical protein QNK25_07090 [Desulfobacterales bacterium]|nr:hypothetical protein [Desulfobacterales bacterium]